MPRPKGKTRSMSNTAIFKVKKVKLLRDLRGVADHHLREHTPANADPERKNLNEINPEWLEMHRGSYPSTQQEVADFWRERTEGMKIRANAVRATDMLVTVPADSANVLTEARQQAYFRDAFKWIENRHGAENVIGAYVHRDERGPHMHVLVVPIHENKLNNSHFYAGKKYEMTKLLDTFHQDVAVHHGLERGDTKERRTYIEMEQFTEGLKNGPEKVLKEIAGIAEQADWVENEQVNEYVTARCGIKYLGRETPEIREREAFQDGFERGIQQVTQMLSQSPEFNAIAQSVHIEQLKEAVKEQRREWLYNHAMEIPREPSEIDADRLKNDIQGGITPEISPERHTERDKGFSQEIEDPNIDKNSPERGGFGLGF